MQSYTSKELNELKSGHKEDVKDVKDSDRRGTMVEQRWWNSVVQLSNSVGGKVEQ